MYRDATSKRIFVVLADKQEIPPINNFPTPERSKPARSTGLWKSSLKDTFWILSDDTLERIRCIHVLAFGPRRLSASVGVWNTMVFSDPKFVRSSSWLRVSDGQLDQPLNAMHTESIQTLGCGLRALDDNIFQSVPEGVDVRAYRRNVVGRDSSKLQCAERRFRLGIQSEPIQN